MNEATSKLVEAIGEINDRFITEAESYLPSGRPPSKRPMYLRVAAMAASLLIVAGVVGAAVWLLPKKTPSTRPSIDSESGTASDMPTESLGTESATASETATETKPVIPPPTYEGAYLTAAQLEELVFNLKLEGATTAYTTVYVPDADALKLAPLPTEAYVPVWRYTPQTKALDESELAADITAVYPRLEAMLGVQIPTLTYMNDPEDGILRAEYKWNSIRYNIRTTQMSGSRLYGTARTAISISGDYRDTIDIHGKPIEVDQRLSDEEILASFSDVRDALFEAFGQTFDSARVERKYGSNNEEGVERLYITYFHASDLPAAGDSIVISFDNFANFAEDVVSADILRDCSITYTRYRAPLSEAYTVEANCRLLTVEEAEVLLHAGYVFGGHVCPLCMEMQTPVSFDEYDFVTVVYYTGDTETQGSALSVPFYAFYKDIGESKNGNRIYARTLVPAVEVSGLAEYFDMQKENHGAGFEYEDVAPEA